MNRINKPHRVPFNWQRAIIGYGLQTGVTLYSNSVMWTHIDSLHSPYGFWLKAGLLGIVDFAGYWLVTMHLFGRSPFTRAYSFWTALILMVTVLVHSGAITKYEISKTENSVQVEAVSEGLAKIAGAEAKAKAEANARAAMDANAVGQRRLASTLARRQDTASSAEAQKNLIEMARSQKTESFLPKWYLDGAMYWALMAMAGAALMFLLLVTEQVIHIEDSNHNGIPDWMEPWNFQQDDRSPTQLATRHAYQQPETGGGFLKRRLRDVESKKS